MSRNRVKGLLGPPRTAGYRPSSGQAPDWMGGNWGAFSAGIVDEMRKDAQVNLCLGYRATPLYQAEFEIECKNGNAQPFITKTLKAFWDTSLDMALEDEAYGHAPSEACYMERDGELRFSHLEPIHPRDARPWTLHGELESVRLNDSAAGDVGYEDEGGSSTGVRLEAATEDRPAKGCWWVHEAKYDRWNGFSTLVAAWWPWRLKTMPDGGMESLFKWLYKHSISCLVIRHPDQSYTLVPGGTPVHAQTLARQLGEQLKAGGLITLDNCVDEHGNPLWEVESWAKIEGDVQSLIKPLEYWDKLIQRGVGIPDEVITHAGDVGGYSRSIVALQAFFMNGDQRTAAKLHQFRRQILGPLVRLNYGDVEYHLQAVPHLKKGKQPTLKSGLPFAREPTPQPGQSLPGALKFSHLRKLASMPCRPMSLGAMRVPPLPEKMLRDEDVPKSWEKARS